MPSNTTDDLIPCLVCDREFDGPSRLAQHFRSSPACSPCTDRAVTYAVAHNCAECVHCEQWFTAKGLNKHHACCKHNPENDNYDAVEDPETEVVPGNTEPYGTPTR